MKGSEFNEDLELRKQLRRLILRNGKTVKFVAEDCDICYRALLNFLHGYTSMRSDYVCRVCYYLGVDLSQAIRNELSA